MDYNMIMRSGKYAGYTIGEMAFKDPRYFRWVKENRPEMLKSHAKKKAQPTKQVQQNIEDHPGKTIKPLEPGSWDTAF